MKIYAQFLFEHVIMLQNSCTSRDSKPSSSYRSISLFFNASKFFSNSSNIAEVIILARLRYTILERLRYTTLEGSMSKLAYWLTSKCFYISERTSNNLEMLVLQQSFDSIYSTRCPCLANILICSVWSDAIFRIRVPP